MKIEELKENLSKFLKSINYELYDLELRKHKKDTILTVYIDRPEGITINEVVDATNQLNPYIDELDPIDGEYMLEVSSAGAEKELRTGQAIKQAIGKYVHIETYEQKIEGYLNNFDGYVIQLKVKNKKIEINYEDVNLIRLAIKF
ncbi:ribosome maturation factor RimP [Candidatus Izemoplasma sp. B36]|uniref:ribosome maturation factor RimP n=1 Tax=Candidatus Izemoplasma sp. B36 TaxID=3242468 RepID=UPI003555D03B